MSFRDFTLTLSEGLKYLHINIAIIEEKRHQQLMAEEGSSIVLLFDATN